MGAKLGPGLDEFKGQGSVWRVRVALGLCLMQAWGDCEVRKLLDLTKSRRAARAEGGGCRPVVRTSLDEWELVMSGVGAELYLKLIQVRGGLNELQAGGACNEKKTRVGS